MSKITTFAMAAVAALVLSGCEIDPPGEALPVGTTMPSFELSGPGGKVSSTDLVGGRTVIVFFRSTCSDCRRELPKIQKLWEEFRGRDDFRLVAITKESDAAVIDYWKEHGRGMPLLFDPNGAVFNLFNVRRVPTLFLFGSDGKVALVCVETFAMEAQGFIDKVNGTT